VTKRILMLQVDDDESSSEDDGDRTGTTQNVEDCDAGGSSCYSNTVFNADDEDDQAADFTSGRGSGTTASVRSVQFNVNCDHDQRPARPQISAVVTKDRRPTVFDKKFQGSNIVRLNRVLQRKRFRL